MKQGTIPAREKILLAASKLFAEIGYDGTTTKAIAIEAKVNEVTLFRSFGSKEALFRTILIETSPFNDIKKAVNFDAEGSIESVIYRNIRPVLTTMVQNRHFFMMLIGEIWRHSEIRKEFREEVMANTVQFLAGNLKKMMDEGRLRTTDPFIAASSLIGMVQSYFLFTYLLGTGEVDPKVEERTLHGFSEILVNGLRPVGDG